MTFTNREIRAKLREMFNNKLISDVEYVHAEMFVNALFFTKNSNHKEITRTLEKRPLGFESGGDRYSINS
ncbi:MAG: hypothetical protein Tp1100SUR763771_4 [Prokaryotic dsDNA virus sp.]|jgi:hypothetical protein|nr:MAG: hypothetical protein Tp1100SUR763771_4 [Prokaryotic dsDNA virus sp.]|tara:strand:- start:1411 stop:1620 length:210 start_codon:yes stop_codon:yes gene_type:complete